MSQIGLRFTFEIIAGKGLVPAQDSELYTLSYQGHQDAATSVCDKSKNSFIYKQILSGNDEATCYRLLVLNFFDSIKK